MTNEERAIRQWLSKPAPIPHACCCVGAAPIYDSNGCAPGYQTPAYTLKATVPDNTEREAVMKMALVVKRVFQLSLEETKTFMRDGTFTRVWREYVWPPSITKELVEAGLNIADVQTNDIGIAYEPRCRCAMAWVELVEDEHGAFYYEINEHRSPDGITHTAKLIGPHRGPYLKST
jgi:hypothetical protein